MKAEPKSCEDFSVRLARLEDAPALEGLIARSVMELQADVYSEEQRRGALGTVFGVDRQLIRDETYFVVKCAGVIVGCGGWSRRKTLFGGDAIAGKNDEALDPATDAARIRAFFVDPDWARRGIGSLILEACEDAAKAYGFTRFELMATLSGVPLYMARGFREIERCEIPLANGLKIPGCKMAKAVKP